MTKYGNRRVRLDGHTFASAAEARRYEALLLLRAAGLITDLAVHPKFALNVNGQKVADYIADFSYLDAETGALVVEDVKGGNATKTAVYRLKKRLMAAIHEIEIREVEA